MKRSLSSSFLTLCSLSLRGSLRNEAMAEARANARLVLAMAIGQPQKSAGSDPRITVSGDLLAPSAHPFLTTVWESQAMAPSDSPN